MDTRTGKIYSEKEMHDQFTKEEVERYFTPITPNRRQARRRKVGRNAPCPCGSGRKFKKCCLIKH